jgi:hypothetical protein
MTGFTSSQKLSWMNNIILALEISGSVFSQKFNATGFEWKQYKEDVFTLALVSKYEDIIL